MNSEIRARIGDSEITAKLIHHEPFITNQLQYNFAAEVIKGNLLDTAPWHITSSSGDRSRRASKNIIKPETARPSCRRCIPEWRQYRCSAGHNGIVIILHR